MEDIKNRTLADVKRLVQKYGTAEFETLTGARLEVTKLRDDLYMQCTTYEDIRDSHYFHSLEEITG